MLAFLQFPIADLRRFAPPDGPRLSRPEWPPRIDLGAHGSFTRYFGPASRRMRGPDQAWLDEKSYYSARRGLIFQTLPGTEPPLAHCACAFRRLFFDGRVVARVEVGISYDLTPEPYRYQYWDTNVHGGQPPEQATGGDPTTVMDAVLKLPSHVPDPAKEKRTYRPLAAQGPSLARLFAQATSTTLADYARPAGALVRAGAPLVIVECTAEQIEALPPRFVRIAPSRVQNVLLAFGHVPFFGGELGVWFASYHQASFAQMRSLRVCMSRLHAEDQALQEVLNACETDVLAYVPDTDEGRRLDEYLGEATAYVNRTRFHGIEQSAIIEAIEASDSKANGTDSKLLAQRLEGVRRQIRIKVEAYDKRARMNRPVNIYRSETYMDNRTINIGDGNTINAPVVIADHIEGSFNAIAKSDADEGVKEILKQLVTQVATVDVNAYPDQARELAQDARTLTDELASPNPRRKWYEISVEGLTQAAKDIGQVGEEIIATLGKLAPKALTLFKV